MGGNANWLGGDSRYRAVRWHIVQDHASSADLGALTDDNIAKDLCSGSDQDTTTNLWVTVATNLTGAAQCDLVEHREIIVDNAGFSNDNAGCVVE